MVKLIENQTGQYGKRPERGEILEEWKKRKSDDDGVPGGSGGRVADVEDVTVCVELR